MRYRLGFLWIWMAGAVLSAGSQNLNPQTTPLSVNNVVNPSKNPTPIRNFKLPAAEAYGVLLEFLTDQTSVFSLDSAGGGNKRLLYWQPGLKNLVNTGEDAIPGSVLLPKNGRYMVYLHSEPLGGQDLNGDGTLQTLLRFYHFSSAQRLTLGIPARSIKGDPSEFDYHLRNNSIAFTRSLTASNNTYQDNSPWHVLNLQPLLTQIEGAAAPTFTPGTTPAVTSTPSLPPTSTPLPGKQADFNEDGRIDASDLLFFQRFWSVILEPSPTPVPPTATPTP